MLSAFKAVKAEAFIHTELTRLDFALDSRVSQIGTFLFSPITGKKNARHSLNSRHGQKVIRLSQTYLLEKYIWGTVSLLQSLQYYYSFVCKFKKTSMPNCKEHLGLLAHGKSCSVVLRI